jgi:hypothetical protein
MIVGGFMDDDRINVQNAIEKFDTFPKPFSREELLAKVKDAVRIILRDRAGRS